MPATTWDKLADRGQAPELRKFVTDANANYYYWEELHRRPPPLGLTPEEAWVAVWASRLNRKPLPLLDVKNRPFSYWLPEPATRILHQVDRQGGGTLATDVDDSSVFSEMRKRVLIDSLMEEAIATSQIEGAVTTRRVAKEMLRSGRKPRSRSEQMIANGYQTIRLLRQRIDRPLSIDLLHEIQESMTLNTLDDASQAGKFRKTDDVFVVDSRDNEVVFTPPPAASLQERLGRLIAFANEAPSSEPFIHPLVRASILHFWLAYEHPYADGNGRTARALFYWYMLKSGYWLFEFLTISRIIHASPMRYYRAFLYSEHDDNDLTYFLSLQLEITRKALAELHQRLADMAQEQRRISALRIGARLNSRQRAVLNHALRHPGQVYSFESHQHSHGISYQTARTDLLGLARRGLLVETGTRKPREFAPAPDLARKLEASPRASHRR